MEPLTKGLHVCEELRRMKDAKKMFAAEASIENWSAQDKSWLMVMPK